MGSSGRERVGEEKVSELDVLDHVRRLRREKEDELNAKGLYLLARCERVLTKDVREQGEGHGRRE